MWSRHRAGLSNVNQRLSRPMKFTAEAEVRSMVEVCYDCSSQFMENRVDDDDYDDDMEANNQLKKYQCSNV